MQKPAQTGRWSAERRQAILAALARDGKVVAARLVEELGVSEDTVRRDLRERAAGGLVQRVHGGALPPAPQTGSFARRRETRSEEKAAIARAAVEVVAGARVLLLDGSTTNLELARLLPDSRVGTVLTNSPPIAVALAEHPGIDVVVIGGRLEGAFVITSDGARRDWRVEGPLFGGWHVMHVHGSPADPDRLFASQWTDWHGQVIQRSDDGGRTWAPVGTASPTPARPAPTSGTTARRTHGSSTASGTWSPRRTTRTRRSRASRTPGSSARPTAAPPGASSRGCAPTRPGTPGPPAPAGSACTRSSSTRRMRDGCSSRSRPPAPSAARTGARPGRSPPAACGRSSSPTPRRRWATASTTWRCTPRAPTRSSCRSTGTSAAPTTPVTTGRR